MNKDLVKIIQDYNNEFRRKTILKQKLLQTMKPDKILKVLRDLGRIPNSGDSGYSSHFENNRWFYKWQFIGNKKTQLRDEIIHEIKKRQIFRKLKNMDFEQLFDEITKIIKYLNGRGIFGAGQMTIYDISCYIGAKENIVPLKVYIHRGVRDGAYMLGLIDNKKKNHKMSLDEVYAKCPELKKLATANDIENFLCIRKKQLANL